MANYITTLQNKVAELEAQLAAVNEKIVETQVYYTSSKFQGFDNDFAYVSTDVMNRIGFIKDIASAPSVLFAE